MSDDEGRADALFHALADLTRRDIVRRVLAGETTAAPLPPDDTSRDARESVAAYVPVP